MMIDSLPDLNTLFTVGTPTVSVLVMFGKLRTNFTELINSVKEFHKSTAVLPMLAFRAEVVEKRVEHLDGRVVSLESRISASEKDRENIHRQLDSRGQ